MFNFLFQGLLLGAAAAAQPGPLQAFLLSQTINNGWRKTLPAAFAPLLSDGPILILVMVILTQTPDWSLNILQIAGGIFLLFLAFGAFKAYKSIISTDQQPIKGSDQSLLKATLMNFLSPNPYIFWATIAGPIFIEGWRQAPINGISFVLGFYLTLIGGFIAFIALFAQTKRLDKKVSQFLSAFSALALFIFGVFQIWQGVNNF